MCVEMVAIPLKDLFFKKKKKSLYAIWHIYPQNDIMSLKNLWSYRF